MTQTTSIQDDTLFTQGRVHWQRTTDQGREWLDHQKSAAPVPTGEPAPELAVDTELFATSAAYRAGLAAQRVDDVDAELRRSGVKTPTDSSTQG